MKKPASKVAKPAQIQPKSQFLFHKNLPPRDFSILTLITAMGCRQCLLLSVVQLKGKHCRKPHCRNGVVDTFRQ
jgi:hypothetical protein